MASAQINPKVEIMPHQAPDAWFHSNRYSAESACEHCQGIFRHEPWCITHHPAVYYAYQIVADPGALTPGDALILHSLGVTWAGKACRGNCKTNGGQA